MIGKGVDLPSKRDKQPIAERLIEDVRHNVERHKFWPAVIVYPANKISLPKTLVVDSVEIPTKVCNSLGFIMFCETEEDSV